jgi:hypothetical protein
MKLPFSLLTLTTLFATMLHSLAEVKVDEVAFGKSLGGWTKLKNTAAEYPLSGSDYRTYKPEISPTPDGGIFISVRIDHVRGWLASDDHAILEITTNAKGGIASAQSTLAIQGQSIKSDVILGSAAAGGSILSTEGAVRVGTDLVANLSAKLLRENIVDAGRVSFPAVLRHNFNRLFQAIRVENPPAVVTPPVPTPETPPAPPTPAPPPEKPKEPEAPVPVPLQVKPYGS